MNKSQLMKAVAERANVHRRDVEHVLENTLAEIQDQIRKGERVSIPGFGTFKQRIRKAREAMNPQTGEKVKVAAAKLPRFLPGRQFKEYVNGVLRSLPPAQTRPMALAPDDGTGAAKATKKTAAKATKKTAKKATKKTAKKATKKTAKAAKKRPAKKTAKKATRRR